MNLRAASPDDLPAILALWAERTALQQAPVRPFKSRFSSDPSVIADRLRSALATKPALLLVAEAEADGALIGFILGQALDEQQAEIAALAIDLHRYHAGVGRQLVDALCAHFAGRGISRFIVTAPRALAVEQAFWHSLKTSCNLELL